MKHFIKIILITGIIFLITGCLTTKDNVDKDDSLFKGVIKKGTLANQKLIQDTMLGIVGKLATLGCDKYESIETYVLQMPKGDVGSRIWKERWIVKGCGKKYPIDITFQEDGLLGAIYTIL